MLSFLFGAFVTEFEVFPYPQLLERPFEAVRAKREQSIAMQKDPTKSAQWRRVEHWNPGVQFHDVDRTLDGYTLLTSAHASAAFLIDMNGQVVHQWGIPFRDAFPDHGRVDSPVPQHKIHWSDAHLFPNGDLIGMYTAEGDTPYGYGLVKLDKNSNVIWTYDGRVHHDFDVEPDGTIWALGHQMRNLEETPLEDSSFWDDEILDDYAVEISPDGKEVDRLSLLNVLAANDRVDVEQWFVDEARWDTLHMNDIDEVHRDFAEHHDFAEPGMLMVSSRSLNAIGLVDMEREEVAWMEQGFWKKQHDPDPLPSGDIIVFDNKGRSGPGGVSRVAEFDPVDLEILWSYEGSRDETFHCPWWGKQTPLSNGNVLIADSLNGRIFEVDRRGERVWVWNTPALRHFEGQKFVPNVKAPVERFEPEELDFEPEPPEDREANKLKLESPDPGASAG